MEAKMGETKHDLVVIGGGPGGYVAAIRGAQLGMNCAVVEKEGALGGTCLRIGCIPSKALLESSELFTEAKKSFGRHGIQFSDVRLDLEAMMKRKGEIVGLLTRGVDSLLKKNKVTRYLGVGSLRGGNVVEVKGREAVSLGARHIILATGSKPVSLPGIELDGERIGTSTEALGYKEVPKHLVVIGGGYIGLELGSVWARLGAKVTVIEFLDRILPGMDLEIAGEAQKIFEKQGIEFRLRTKVRAASVAGNECEVQCEGGESIKCDRVLVAVGRIPNTEGLGLESAGVKVDERKKIIVDSKFQTSVPGIYAVGDVIGGIMLAHKAEEEGVACVEMLAGKYGHVDYEAIPGVVYTNPEIATVGKTEEQLTSEGVKFKKGSFPFRGNGRAHAIGMVEGKVKVLADEKTDRILGVHIIGPRAGDLIAEAVAAMSFHASSEDVARTCHAHPTLSEAFKEAALAVDDRQIHA